MEPYLRTYAKAVFSLRQHGTLFLFVCYFSPCGRKITYKGRAIRTSHKSYILIMLVMFRYAGRNITNIGKEIRSLRTSYS
jgi:hypothetical protein